MSADRILFVSDLHLDENSRLAVHEFTAFLGGEALDSRALYILGDLFETWVGDDDDEPVRESVCTALREFTRHVPCHVVRGNRDFLLGSGFEERTGCQLLPDPVRVQADGLRFLVTHGDLLCTADATYQRFREFAHDPGVQRDYLGLPLAARRRLALHAREGSQNHTREAPEDIMDVDAGAVEALFRLGDADVLIHGHTHRPAVHRLHVDGRERRRIVLGDWYENGSYLAIGAEGQCSVLRLPTRSGSTLGIASSSSRV